MPPACGEVAVRDTDRTLIVAPYVGEFGWELMTWQGRVRRRIAHERFRSVAVCAQPDRRPLYGATGPETSVRFCPIGNADLPGEPNQDHRIDDAGRPLPADELRRIAVALAADACARCGLDTGRATFMTPDYHGTICPTTRAHQWFDDLRDCGPITTDVLLVPRHRRLAGERNRSAAWWDDLAARLRQGGLTVETYRPPLGTAIRQLSRTRLAIGASTGGLHLAGLCRCPHYVWGSGSDVRWTPMGVTNRQRYETLWNPFGTPCIYDESGWQPPVDHVVEQTRRALNRIGLRPGSNGRHWTLKPKWRVKRQLARLFDSDPRTGVCPWRVRTFVRERLV